MPEPQTQTALRPAEVIQKLPQALKDAASRTHALAREIGMMMTPGLLCLALVEREDVKRPLLTITSTQEDAYASWVGSLKSLFEELRGPNRVAQVGYSAGTLELLNEAASLTPVQLLKKVLGSTYTPAQVVEFFGRANITVSRLETLPQTATTPEPGGADILKKFCVDLTEEARAGKHPPTIGRDEETKRVFQLLGRRYTKSFVLVGESGTGRSAIVRKAAKMIVDETCPEEFKAAKILEMNLDDLIAGTKYRGELEEKIKAIAKAISGDESTRIILVIRDIHRTAGEGAANVAAILKPDLLAGKIQVIGITDEGKYNKLIASDKDLQRCFRKLEVEELDSEQTLEVLRSLKPAFEEPTNGAVVTIDNDAISAAVEFSIRCITSEFNPAKSIAVLDAQVSKARQEGRDRVTKHDVLLEIETITEIPVTELQMDEKERILQLADRLKAQIIGQDHAIDAIVQAIKRARAGFGDENRPIGSFIFAGPTGVGKTDLVNLLARFFFLRKPEQSIIRLDMSEYGEKHSTARAIGAPPGYVGYEDGGQLTEAVFHQPYSIVLFDEMEKAHPEVFNLLLQILEDGHLTDSKGRKVSFKNTLIIMTSNIQPELARNSEGFLLVSDDEAKKALREKLLTKFKPEFINRVDELVCFRHLTLPDMERIAEVHLNRGISERSARKKNMTLEFTTEAMTFIARKGYDPIFGARPIKRAIVSLVENPIVEMYLAGTLHDNDKLYIGLRDEQLQFSVNPKVEE